MHTERQGQYIFVIVCFLISFHLGILSLGDAKWHMWNWCEAECLLSQITWSPISSVVEWNLNIVFRMSYSHTNQWSLHSDRWLMVASKLFGQLHFCQFQLNSKSDIMKFVLVRKKVFQCAFSPVWPQADPWAQHHSVNQVNVCQWQYCIDQVWYCTHNNARPRFSSPPPQSLQSVCVCVFSGVVKLEITLCI